MENNAKSSIGQAGPVLICWTACLLVSACLPAAAYAEILYTFTDLGSLGGERSLAFGINDAGQIVGTSSLAGTGQHAFLYDSTGMHDLGGFGKLNSIAYGINNAGQVVGECDDSTSDRRAFATNPTRDLGTLASGSTQAYAINDNGLIVGISQHPAGDWHLFSYSGTGPMRDLGSVIKYAYVRPDVNASGEIAVTLYDASGYTHAVRTTPGGDLTTAIDLGTLGGSSSRAFGINDAGAVVGSSYATFLDIHGHPYTVQHAVLWPAFGGVMDLDPLRRGTGWSQAFGVNNAGQVVGYVDPSGHNLLREEYAFIYENGTLRDLNSLVSAPDWRLSQACAINEAGQIVGFGSYAWSETPRAFLLTPIPEPATLVLILVGGIYGARRSVARDVCRRLSSSFARTRPRTTQGYLGLNCRMMS